MTARQPRAHLPHHHQPTTKTIMIADIIAKIRGGNHDPVSIWKDFHKQWGYSSQSLICSLIKSILIEPVLKAEAEAEAKAKEMAAVTGADEDSKAELDAALQKIETELTQNQIWIKIERMIRDEKRRLAQIEKAKNTPPLP
jgi:hypothetical protein